MNRNSLAIWYCLSGEHQFGPLTPSELRQLVSIEALSPTDLVWRKGIEKLKGGWVPAGQIKGLFPESATAGRPSRPISLGDIIEVRLMSGDPEVVLPAGAFSWASAEAAAKSRVRRELLLPLESRVALGYELRLLLPITLASAAVLGNKLFVATGAPVQRGEFDLFDLQISFRHGVMQWVQVAAPGCQTIKLNQYGRRFFEWLPLLVRMCTDRDSGAPPLPRQRVSPAQAQAPPPIARGGFPWPPPASPVQTQRTKSVIPITNASEIVETVAATSPNEPAKALLDLNSASEAEIAALPGIGPILAKRATGVRQSGGGFETLEGFAESLGLKPHIVERLRPLVLIGPVAHAKSPKLKGRVVDF